MGVEYQAELNVAKERLKDFEERGKAAVGESWQEYRKRMFTPEELAESDLRVKLIGKLIETRRAKGITQRKLAELSGIKQPMIARIEKFDTTPRIDTLAKLYYPLGLTLTPTLTENQNLSDDIFSPAVNLQANH